MSDKRPVLIIEDDPEIAEIVAFNLRDLGLETDHVSNGREGVRAALTGNYSLVILDVMLPEMDGFTVCTRLRETDAVTPLLMLTARSDEIDRVIGLEIGADDYLTKPFSVRELTARVRALLRRAGTAPPEALAGEEAVSFGALEIDLVRRRVLLRGKVVDLTVKEFDLLALFARNPGRAFSRAELLDLVWGYQFSGYEHTVNTHINRLRGKIEVNPGRPVYLKTVWGVGYRFAERTELDSPEAAL